MPRIFKDRKKLGLVIVAMLLVGNIVKLLTSQDEIAQPTSLSKQPSELSNLGLSPWLRVAEVSDRNIVNIFSGLERRNKTIIDKQPTPEIEKKNTPRKIEDQNDQTATKVEVLAVSVNGGHKTALVKYKDVTRIVSLGDELANTFVITDINHSGVKLHPIESK